MWSNIEYFQKAGISVAEKPGVQMALHPDDPPIPELRGIARILISARNYRRVMNIVPKSGEWRYVRSFHLLPNPA